MTYTSKLPSRSLPNAILPLAPGNDDDGEPEGQSTVKIAGWG
jgi:hypothetical protein